MLIHHTALRPVRERGIQEAYARNHDGKFDGKDLEELTDLSACSCPRREPLTECPLCVDSFDARSMPINDILNHVAEHMMSLALLSLPSDDYGEPAESDKFTPN